MLRSSLNLLRSMSWVLSSSTENLSETTSEWKTEKFTRKLIDLREVHFFQRTMKKRPPNLENSIHFFKKTPQKWIF